MNGSEQAGGRIFQRLLIFNLIVVVVVSIVPPFVFYQYFKSLYDKEINSLNLQTVRQFQQAIDEPIVKAAVNFPNLYLSELESNEALVYPFTHDISKDSAAILKIGRRMDDIRNNTPFLHSIDLYYPLGHLLFLGNRLCMLDESECDLGSRRDWFDLFRTTDANIAWIAPRPAETFDRTSVATYVRSLPFFGSKEARQGVVAVNLNIGELNRQLRSLKLPPEGVLLIVDEAGNLIAHNQPEAPYADFRQQPFVARLIAAGDEGMFDARIDDRASVVSFIKSDYNNWRYVSVASVESVNRKSNQFRGWMLAVSLAFLALNAALAVLLTKRAHKPISNRMEALRQSLERNRPLVRHNVILGLLQGSARDERYLQEYEAVLGSWPETDRLLCFVLQLGRDDGHSPQMSIAADYHVIERLEGDGSLADIRAIKDERGRILGIAHYGGETQPDDIARRLAAIIGETQPGRYALAMGGSYPWRQEHIAFSFAEASESLPYAFLYPDALVVRFEELRIAARKEIASPVKVLDDIAAALRSADEKKLRQLIGGVLAEIRTGDYTIQSCRDRLADVVSVVHKTTQSFGFGAGEPIGGDMRELARGIMDVNEFETSLYDVVRLVVARLNERKQQIDPDFAARIIRFVHDNIANQLSLDLVAEYANVSPTYLSKMFKVMTGSNFSEYVTELKLEQAEALLRERKLSVQEISARIGYHSTHHFIRLFKEKHGQTPKQYQRALAGRQADGDDDE